MVKIKVAAGADGIGGIRGHFGFNILAQLILYVEDLVVSASQVDQDAFITVDDKASSGSFYREIITAAAFPGNGFSFSEFETSYLGIRCLPIIFEGITAAG